MNSKFIHDERIIRKINYLFETIEANPLQSTNLEIALLRQYAVDLYDSILSLEAEQNDEMNISKQVMEDLRSERARVAKEMTDDDLDLSQEEQEEVTETQLADTLEEILAEEAREKALAKEEQRLDDAEEANLNNGILAAAIGAGGALSVGSLLGEEPKEDLEAEAIESILQDHEEETKEKDVVLEEKEEDEPQEEQELVQEDEIPEVSFEDLEKKIEEVEEEPMAEEPAEEQSFSFTPNPTVDPEPLWQAEVDENVTQVLPNAYRSNLSSNGLAESSGSSLEDEARTEVLTDLVAKLREKENAAETLMQEAAEPSAAVEKVEDIASLNLEPVVEEKAPESLNDLLAQKAEEDKSLGESLNYNTGNRFGISFNQRYSYIENLFNDNANEYDGTIAELSKCSNVIEAFTYLNLNVKSKYRWDKDDPIVKEFMEQIKETFLNED